MTDAVLFDARDDGIAVITLNRPEARNALGKDIRAGLFAAWDRFERDPALRVAILTGTGDRAFCAGSDIKDNYVAHPGEEAPKSPFTIMYDLYKPMIAAINGHANGGGLEQALACDIRVAAHHAQFGLGEVRLGWLPGGGGTQRLPRLISMGRALEMLYTGGRIGAEEALRIGLVDYVMPMSRIMTKCEEIAAEICKSAPLAVSRIKQAAMRGLDLPLAGGIKLEHELYKWLQGTEDAREGARAFAEKRPPQWKGK